MFIDMGYSYGRNEVEAQTYAEYESRNSSEKIGERCAGTDAASLPECIADEIKASREDQRAEYDLAAQREMGRWAWWMILISVGAFSVSAIALWFIYETLRATKRQVEQAVQAERPHLFFFRTERWEDNRPKGVTFKNYGRTPAIVERLQVDIGLFEAPPKPDQAAPKGRVFHKTAIATYGEEWPRKHYFPLEVAADDLARQGTGNWRLFVYGAIHYHDPFGEKHRTWFCHVYDGLRFVPGDLNDPDLNGYD